MSGYNTSLVVCGSTQSARSAVINGGSRDSIFSRVIERLFNKLDEGQYI